MPFLEITNASTAFIGTTPASDAQGQAEGFAHIDSLEFVRSTEACSAEPAELRFGMGRSTGFVYSSQLTKGAFATGASTDHISG